MWLIAVEHIRAVRSPAASGGIDRRRTGRRSCAGRRVRSDAPAGAVPALRDANPILTAADLPYPANSVFNPGAARVGGETLLLVRVEDLRGISQLHVARSADGVTDWRFDPEPLLRSDVDHDPEEIWGCEDPAPDLAARSARSGRSPTPPTAGAARSSRWR